MSAQSQEALISPNGVQEVAIKMGELTAKEKARIMPDRPQQREGAAARFNHIKKVIAVMSGKGEDGNLPAAGRGED